MVVVMVVDCNNNNDDVGVGPDRVWHNKIIDYEL
jgi:hypothetical protein